MPGAKRAKRNKRIGVTAPNPEARIHHRIQPRRVGVCARQVFGIFFPLYHTDSIEVPHSSERATAEANRMSDEAFEEFSEDEYESNTDDDDDDGDKKNEDVGDNEVNLSMTGSKAKPLQSDNAVNDAAESLQHLRRILREHASAEYVR